ncbi:hypothetical protein TWF281_004151 [Arthrobotrys megalospora]
MWDVHQVKYFKCPDCDWGAARKDNLVRFHKPRCEAGLKKGGQKSEAPAMVEGSRRPTIIRVSVLGSQVSTVGTNAPSDKLNGASEALATGSHSLEREPPPQNNSDHPPQHSNLEQKKVHPEQNERLAAYEQEIENLRKNNAALQERVWDLEEELEETAIDRNRLRSDYQRLKQEVRKRRREEAAKSYK